MKSLTFEATKDVFGTTTHGEEVIIHQGKNIVLTNSMIGLTEFIFEGRPKSRFVIPLSLKDVGKAGLFELP